MRALQQIAGSSRQVTADLPNIGCREALADCQAAAEVIRSLTWCGFELTTDRRSVRGPGGPLGTEGSLTSWTDATRQQVAREGRDRIVSHLRDRDQASFNLPVPVVVRLVNRSDSRAALAEAISSDLADGQFMLADLTARFVSVARVHDGQHERIDLVRFDHESLVNLMGTSVLWRLTESAKSLDIGDSQLGGAIGTAVP